MGITSSIGLASGIDSGALIQQLLAVEARPRTLAQQRVVQLQTQQAAWLSINSSISGLRNSSSAFRTNSTFDRSTALSSNEAVISATADNNAAIGTYTFFAERLVTTQQNLSRGFADRDVSGLGAQTFTFEDSAGGVRTETRLSELNGGEGVSRGEIRITDKSGATAEIDLSRAVTVDDVLETINSDSSIGVVARFENDRLVIEDETGGAGTLRVEDLFGSETAASFGVAGTAAGAATEITGANVRTVSGGTALSLLGDGTGVEIRDGSTDFTITAADGSSLAIDLGLITDTETVDDEEVTTVVQTRATTLQDVIDAINAKADADGVNLTAGISGDGQSLVINDNTGGPGNLIVESASGRTTAADLGIETAPAGVSAAAPYEGLRLLGGINSVLTRSLNGGAGLTSDEFTFTDRLGNTTTLNVSQDAINGSLTDVIEEINATLQATGVGVRVGVNAAGNGLAASDISGGSGLLSIAGAGAEALGIDVAGTASSSFEGASAQKQWIANSTLLTSLNNGQGIGNGEIIIRDASGAVQNIEIDNNVTTVGDLLSFLNSRPNISINARINDQGDGILIEDTSGGNNQLEIEDLTGSVAANLNIAGEFAEEGGVIRADGSYETTITFDENDTLDDVVEAINLEGVGVIATVINDGSPGSPFRLSFTARDSGTAGRLLIDTGGLDIGLEEISAGDDAVVFYGAGDPKDAVLITSSTNTISGIARGLNITLNSVSESPVEVTVDRDRGAIVEEVSTFVDSFNSVIEAIDGQTFYNAETEQRGPLLGDSTAQSIRSRLFTAIQRPVSGFDNEFRFLFEVGIRVSASGTGDGNTIEFDRERFNRAYEQNPDAVRRLFEEFRQEAREPIEIAPGITTPDDGPDRFSRLGVAEQIKQLTEQFTNSIDGVITRRTNSLDTRIELQNDRIDSLTEQLDRKRLSLEREFANLELVIAQLQTQQQQLGQLNIAG